LKKQNSPYEGYQIILKYIFQNKQWAADTISAERSGSQHWVGVTALAPSWVDRGNGTVTKTVCQALHITPSNRLVSSQPPSDVCILEVHSEPKFLRELSLQLIEGALFTLFRWYKLKAQDLVHSGLYFPVVRVTISIFRTPVLNFTPRRLAQMVEASYYFTMLEQCWNSALSALLIDSSKSDTITSGSGL